MDESESKVCWQALPKANSNFNLVAAISHHCHPTIAITPANAPTDAKHHNFIIICHIFKYAITTLHYRHRIIAAVRSHQIVTNCHTKITIQPLPYLTHCCHPTIALTPANAKQHNCNTICHIFKYCTIPITPLHYRHRIIAE